MMKRSETPGIPGFPLGALLILVSSLAACGGNQGQSSEATDSGPNDIRKEEIERYREEVKQRVSTSVVRSFSREWGVSESKVECVLADVSVTELRDAASNTEVAAVFDECGVDPTVVK